MERLFHLPSEAGERDKNAWFTPDVYLRAAERVFGESIDLDPASCELANRSVRARRFYALEQDGLQQDWTASSLWLNPPFTITGGKSGQAIWSHRLVEEYRRGNVKQAILLVTANTEVTWFDPLYEFLICFKRLRMDYVTPFAGAFTTHQSRFGTCFVYLGFNGDRFVEEFSAFGHVMRLVGPRRAGVEQYRLFE